MKRGGGLLDCLGRVEDTLWGVTVVLLVVFSVVVVLGLDVVLVVAVLDSFWWVWPVLVLVLWVEFLFGLSLLLGWLRRRDGDGGGDV